MFLIPEKFRHGIDAESGIQNDAQATVNIPARHSPQARMPMSPHAHKDTLTLLARIPAIPVRRGDLTELYARLKSLLDRSPRIKLLSILKYAAYIVLLVNLGSLPFVWHSESHRIPFFLLFLRESEMCGSTRVFIVVRVLWPILLAKVEYSVLRLKLIFASKKERARALITWGENLSPVGANPFEFTTVYRRWSSAYFKSIKIHFHVNSYESTVSPGIDDIDMFGIHLSNSSYAKAHPFSHAVQRQLTSPPSRHSIQRVQRRSSGVSPPGVAAEDRWPSVVSPHLRPAGPYKSDDFDTSFTSPATHYHFLREIPPLVRYEVRLTIGSWDHKWVS